ncbi:MAG: molybdate ABC transporter substrate-binding protein [Lachnospiraceae bacterium]|nr:molybdate ABC transporter substrate-binding protein [Lachnospiraceae bacterium]
MRKVTALILVLSICVCAITACSGGAKTEEKSDLKSVQTTDQASEKASLESSEQKKEENKEEGEESPKAETEEKAEKENALDQEVELVVFAAASLTETLDEIAKNYKNTAPNVTLIFNFDSSGTLKTQIEEGAACDLFISAAKKQMDQLDITADKEVNTEGLDLVDPDTRIDLLENKVVLVVPGDNPASINSFDDMVKALKDKSIMLAMGNEDVPVGQYTKKILDHYGLDEESLNKDGLITYGSNVKEVTTQVAEGSVDCGVIYSTDAYSAGLDAVDTATVEMCGQVIYPAALLKEAAHTEEAKAFLEYLRSEESAKVFESVGFTCIK